MLLKNLKLVVKGAGEMASGVAWRLFNSGFRRICMTDVAQPQAVRREVSFCEAIYDGQKTVHGVTAKLITSMKAISEIWEIGQVPVIVDPEAGVIDFLKPDVIIDAILAKKNLGTKITNAPLVIGLGPGFCAGRDVHLVVETNRGHDLGRLIHQGEAEKNTGVPGVIAGYGAERVFRAPKDGRFIALSGIGDLVEEGDLVADVDGLPVKAQIKGVIRGILRNGTHVWKGMKAGDVDPRGKKDFCYSVSEKTLAIAGGVLEGILSYYNK
ncbi:putative 4-hydroxybenzoyl-CoA reductase molybdenum cofactor biosynthesis protein [uncultured Desulfobacterium sp.]|uniref:Putative 4-hydroxybenzoyl-CoA reductase molybdenum cofactor biosynthesis protein n=1 Tax=uncultured Desulfobacterium sp. TaxID=201089 RepID=A0A445MX94_9BACT|nr:putative 4-hydroxybenzoyl-CoA reductase molybdenum cofactor biosynthesis protein [uncultured Desulfobacterium sp.]